MATRFGMRLKALRTKHGLSLRNLEKKVGVSYAYLSMLERGVKANPSLDLVKKLARALKVTVGDLVA